MELVIIAAIGKNGELGYRNKLLWHISEDLKRFKRLTSGYTVIMGRSTFESIGSKPLPQRRNIVLSRFGSGMHEGVEWAASIDEALGKVRDEEQVFVIGGAKVYEGLLPFSDRMYLTRVHESYRADCYFPEIKPDEWMITEQVNIEDDLQAGVNYSYLTMHRKR
ncbi:MAG: dihydrofolate reductase [Bacteroidales bacterium]|nr:dihydrofolate reductase [Bacteroidales bacterium]